MARARAGDREAFSVLVQRHQATVFRVCQRILGDREDAEDATQEAFVRAYRKLDTFQGQSAFRTWLLRLTVNVSLNERTRQRPTAPLDDERAAAGAGVDTIAQAEVAALGGVAFAVLFALLSARPTEAQQDEAEAEERPEQAAPTTPPHPIVVRLDRPATPATIASRPARTRPDPAPAHALWSLLLVVVRRLLQRLRQGKLTPHRAPLARPESGD